MYRLQPTKQHSYNDNIFGFDIETYDKNRKFYCASIYHHNPRFCKTFFDKDELIKYFKLRRFRRSIVAATNLSFDFFGTFFNTDDIRSFNFLLRGSNLLTAKTYLKDKGFIKKNVSGLKGIEFLDTLNYAMLSVEELGKLINIKKLDKPRCIGRLPNNKDEEAELIKYNIRDAKISCKAMRFLYDSFYSLGATPKMTIASTSMSLFRNKYLDDVYYRHPREVLVDQFNAYYGGRTEVFARGKIKDYEYYDFNSLYPAVMKEEVPNPNSIRVTRKDDVSYIEEYEGISDVIVKAPYMKYPLLPWRDEAKLLFPYGMFRGWYTHLELRKALELGYSVVSVFKTYYYKKTCRPFVSFVNDMYEKRMQYKKQRSSMAYVVKILMNSLYGKFGQKFMEKDNLVSTDITLKELNKYEFVERLNDDFFRVKQDARPACFCIPSWACYITARARMKLYDKIVEVKPCYVDTDSLMTDAQLDASSALGELKHEFHIDEGIVVKPKFYAVTSGEKESVKIKGVALKLNFNDFKKLLVKPRVQYQKFCKIREALRRGFLPNEIIEIIKELALEDDKRNWHNKKFGFNSLQDSNPRKIIQEEILTPHLVA